MENDGVVIEESVQSQEQKLPDPVSMSKGTYQIIRNNQEIKFTLETPFEISKTLITQKLYSSVMGNDRNVSYFRGDNRPVENVTFFDTIEFCNKLSLKNGFLSVYTIDNDKVSYNHNVTGFRLPFEIEWECCLGGDIIEIEKELDKIAWYNSNSNGQTRDVGLKEASCYGVFDLLGNVWEWCFDCYRDDHPLIPVLEGDNNLRVIKGGSFLNFTTMFTNKYAFRKKRGPLAKEKYIGFRVVLQNNN